jgi:hypothetical protein
VVAKLNLTHIKAEQFEREGVASKTRKPAMTSIDQHVIPTTEAQEAVGKRYDRGHIGPSESKKNTHRNRILNILLPLLAQPSILQVFELLFEVRESVLHLALDRLTNCICD